MDPIKNKVAESEITVFNLEDLWDARSVAEVDLAEFLFEGLVLRERDFRARVKDSNWAQYTDAHVAVHCSTDAIVPTWAYMLVAAKLEPYAVSVSMGSREDLVRDQFIRSLEAHDWEQYRDGLVVVKGCASKLVPPVAYMIATRELQKVATKVMYGEPCSSVPIWRRPSRSGDEAAARKVVRAKLPSGRT